MAREFYIAASTATSRKLYRDLKDAAPRLGKVSALGGWPVHDLVAPAASMESLDVDVLIHETAAWAPTIRLVRDHGFVWRRLGRAFDRRLVLPGHEDDEDAPAVDVFYTTDVRHDLLQNLFGAAWAANLKEMPYTGFVPDLRATVADKLATLPLRPANDPKRKRLKDALDLCALLFHNRAGIPADQLLPARDLTGTLRALGEIRDVAPYEAEVGELSEALRLHAWRR